MQTPREQAAGRARIDSAAQPRASRFGNGARCASYRLHDPEPIAHAVVLIFVRVEAGLLRIVSTRRAANYSLASRWLVATEHATISCNTRLAGSSTLRPRPRYSPPIAVKASALV